MYKKSLGPPSNINPYISPKYTKNDWKSLNLDNHNDNNWNTAIEIFKDRINGRFLKPINKIIKHPNKKINLFCGFIIIAIDCLIIETLYQFYKGTDETQGSHKKSFWHFFKNSIYFNDEIDTKEKAYVFYKHFRCGILHQAQTKKMSKIRINRNKMAQPINPKCINDGLIIDRKIFHNSLVKDIEHYCEILLNPKNTDEINLRKNFIKKMDYIVD